MDLFQIDGLSHSYAGRQPALAIDRWSVAAGSIIGLTGPNGSGKSTLLRLLGLIERPSRGEIRFQGVPTHLYTSNLRDRIALLPQETFLLKRTIYKNIAYGLRIRKERAAEAERVCQAMGLVGLDPDAFAERPWFALSGGEARRVGLAARLVLRPQVLLLDEPTASVDDASAQRMKEAVLQAHRQWGATLIIASHDVPWLQEVCDEMLHLLEGRMVGPSRLTLLSGPWQALDEEHVFVSLAEDQIFVAVRPPEGKACTMAAVDPDGLSIVNGAPADGARSIDGVLTGLALNQRSGKSEASILVGRTLFRMNVSAEEIEAGGLIPGRPVRMRYDPRLVQWH